MNGYWRWFERPREKRNDALGDSRLCRDIDNVGKSGVGDPRAEKITEGRGEAACSDDRAGRFRPLFAPNPLSAYLNCPILAFLGHVATSQGLFLLWLVSHFVAILTQKS